MTKLDERVGLIFEELQTNVEETLRKAEERMMSNYANLELVVCRALKGRRSARPEPFRRTKDNSRR
jgi:hypothetical protein